jgi:hypothetical protein
MLFDALSRVAEAQLRSLHHLSLPQILTEAARGGGADSHGTTLYARTVERLRDRSLPLRRYPEAPSGYDPRALMAEENPDNVPEAPETINMLLVAGDRSEWADVVAEHAGSPDYLRSVQHADQQRVMYLRIVQGVPLTSQR